MRTIMVTASRRYEVVIGAALLAEAGVRTRSLFPGAQKAAVVTDSNVQPLYLESVIQLLSRANFEATAFTIPAGEGSKNGETYLRLLEFLAQNRLTRSDVLLVLGGGVVGDLAGFAAATYQRGIACVQLPTTLLSMVDSSVGGKTAIDLEAGKNLAGAFSQPALVLCDTDTLSTLPAAAFSDGCAEVIKYGMLGNRELLTWLLQGSISEQPEEVIAQCVTMKRDIVQRDELDTGERQLLNLGHTVGHAIERCSGYAVSHGQAVAAGMAVITRAAVRKGHCPGECLDILGALLSKYGLPDRTQYTAGELYQAALGDKKRANDRITLVVPTGIGKSALLLIPVTELLDWIKTGVLP